MAMGTWMWFWLIGAKLLIVEPCGRNGYLLVVFGHNALPFQDRPMWINDMGAELPRIARENPRTSRGHHKSEKQKNKSPTHSQVRLLRINKYDKNLSLLRSVTTNAHYLRLCSRLYFFRHRYAFCLHFSEYVLASRRDANTYSSPQPRRPS